MRSGKAVGRLSGRRTAARRTAAVAAVAVAALVASGCSSDGPSPIHPGPTGSKGTASASAGGTTAAPSPSASTPPAKGTAKVTGTVATGLDSPWGVAPLPDGTLLVASRNTGRISRVDPVKKTTTQVGGVPGVQAGGEGGLLGLAVSPDFGSDREIYAYFTTESDNRIARLLYDTSRPAGQQLGAPDTILRGIPSGTIHNGGRIAFGPDKMLYAGTGETNQRGLAQDKSSLAGKILRMTPDGQPPKDNPTPGSLDYSDGHRNVQGLAWDDQGRLWASEFGQDTWDELNLIEPGKNYGWPVVEGIAHRAGYVDPVAQWHTDEASPSGIAYAGGAIWMAALHGARLWRIPLAGARPSAAPQSFFSGTYGRLRTVVTADDGSLFVTTSNTDGRGTPAKEDDRILHLTVS
ncbi:Glucose/arabinose dehydrogenase, beta-propeller fold [Actinacidiphila alni]|uniref:Glucose/arabinose dehydrogenase, beta-propeller fold n=1 Tax=Actinacidiphila alni TaxID=380248 RepID=A0A1I2JJR0_9ACTN|nr:Glucose/arabinose dehydrogenase, beta-propeller fold [Actinacidiphila alni]